MGVGALQSMGATLAREGVWQVGVAPPVPVAVPQDSEVFLSRLADLELRGVAPPLLVKLHLQLLLAAHLHGADEVVARRSRLLALLSCQILVPQRGPIEFRSLLATLKEPLEFDPDDVANLGAEVPSQAMGVVVGSGDGTPIGRPGELGVDGLAPVGIPDDLEVAAGPNHFHLQVVHARHTVVLAHLLLEGPLVPTGHDVVSARVFDRPRGRQGRRKFGRGAVLEGLDGVGALVELAPGHSSPAARDAELDPVPVSCHPGVLRLHGPPDPDLLLRELLLPDPVEGRDYLILEVDLEVPDLPTIWVERPNVLSTVDRPADRAPLDGRIRDGCLLDSCVLASEAITASQMQKGISGRVPGRAVGEQPTSRDIQVAKGGEGLALLSGAGDGGRGAVLVYQLLPERAAAVYHPVEALRIRVGPEHGRAGGGLGPVGMQDLPPVAVYQDLELLEAVHAKGDHVGEDLLAVARPLGLLHLV
mmetsp:Transcript_26816/g.79947  ORF Transcript_26816/g.79947 Transcript_26816/m.79947 type:complete len:475 (-) Transcript_26816:468-1892(-)